MCLFASSKMCFYFGLKHNSTSTRFLLAVNLEVHWLHTVNINRLMTQKQLAGRIQRLLNQYHLNWQVSGIIFTHQTSIIGGSHLILGSKETSYFCKYPCFIYSFGLILNAFCWSQTFKDLACSHWFTARKQKGSPSTAMLMYFPAYHSGHRKQQIQ